MIPTDNTSVNKFSPAATRLPSKSTEPCLRELSAKARQQKPLSKLQWVLLLIMIEDCNAQSFSNRKVTELAKMSGYTQSGVSKALAHLMALGFIQTKKQTRGRASVRSVTRLGFAYFPKKFKINNKKGSQSRSQTKHSLYKISYSSEEEQKDLLRQEKIIQMTNKESECFRAIGFSPNDEIIILNRIKRSQLSPEARFVLARDVLARHYKVSIQSPRAYYLTAIANHREATH